MLKLGLGQKEWLEKICEVVHFGKKDKWVNVCTSRIV